MPTPNLLDETFEGTGYAAMTGATLIGSGSSLDPDYATSNAGSPAGWSAQCLRAISVVPNTQARKNHTFGTALTGQLYFRDEFYIVSETIATGTANIIFSAYNTGFTANIFHFWLKRDTPDFKLVASVGNGGGTQEAVKFGITTGVRYTAEMSYHLTTHAWDFRVDGVSIGTGTASSATAADCQLLYIGSDVFNAASGNPVEVLHDNVGIGNQTWLGPTTGAALSGTALAGINEADIVAGGKTIVITLTGSTWVT